MYHQMSTFVLHQRQGEGAHHEEKINKAADDIEARVLEPEQVQVLAAQLEGAPRARVR